MLCRQSVSVWLNRSPLTSREGITWGFRHSSSLKRGWKEGLLPWGARLLRVDDCTAEQRRQPFSSGCPRPASFHTELPAFLSASWIPTRDALILFFHWVLPSLPHCIYIHCLPTCFSGFILLLTVLSNRTGVLPCSVREAVCAPCSWPFQSPSETWYPRKRASLLRDPPKRATVCLCISTF